MAIDAGLWGQFAPRVKSIADFTADRQRQQANALALQTGEMGLSEKRNALAQDGALQEAYRASGGDPERLKSLLVDGGMYKAGAAHDMGQAKLASEKAQTTQRLSAAKENDAQAALKYIEAERNKTVEMARLIGSIDPNDNEALGKIWEVGVQKGYIKPEHLEKMVADAGPAGSPQRAQYIKMQVGFGLSEAEKQTKALELLRIKTTQRGQDLTQQTAREGHGVTMRGQDIGASTARAGHAVTMRGQNMVDARGRDGLALQREALARQGGLDGNGKPLPPTVVNAVTEARDSAATMERIQSSFKPEFAGKGLYGLGADASMMVKGNLGMDKEAVEWWKNYRKDVELTERHALFGAALTPSEQASWRSADIAPGMDPDVVATNLATRAALSKKVFANKKQDMIDAGHNPARIDAIAGRNDNSGSVSDTWAAPKGWKIEKVK